MSTPRASSSPPLRSSYEQARRDPAVTTGLNTSHHVDYVLGLADDALVSAQRMGWWISRAPQLEEDLALANIGLDLLGQARSLLSHAGELEGAGRDEDDLAYWRDERDFRNVKLVERPQEDFGVAMARLLVLSTWQSELYAALQRSSDPTLAAVAAKAAKEVAYHLERSSDLVVRLGDGSDESHRRMQAALDALWPYVGEMFLSDEKDAPVAAAGIAPDPASLKPAWEAMVRNVLTEATLTIPKSGFTHKGGKRGIHTEHLGYILADLQFLQRAYPGSTW
jgi:ring-1,2-phenylacetyl-CoA epoxidase subunit PaaC